MGNLMAVINYNNFNVYLIIALENMKKCSNSQVDDLYALTNYGNKLIKTTDDNDPDTNVRGFQAHNRASGYRQIHRVVYPDPHDTLICCRLDKHMNRLPDIHDHPDQQFVVR